MCIHCVSVTIGQCVTVGALLLYGSHFDALNIMSVICDAMMSHQTAVYISKGITSKNCIERVLLLYVCHHVCVKISGRKRQHFNLYHIFVTSAYQKSIP